MIDLRTAAQQALEALECCEAWDHDMEQQKTQAITALKAALAEPTWCEIHQHHKWCEHNGGVMGTTGWEAP